MPTTSSHEENEDSALCSRASAVFSSFFSRARSVASICFLNLLKSFLASCVSNQQPLG